MIRTQELVERSGITSRALRHYDQIGLLRPAHVDPGGQRWYGDSEVLRLQRILVLRELGLPLVQIRHVLDGETDHREALRRHVEDLTTERHRVDRMIHAVQSTLDRLERGLEMDETAMFDGFASTPYADEAAQRWPAEYVESQQRVGALTSDQMAELVARGRAITDQLGELFVAGELVDSESVQAVIADHYRWICSFWSPNRQSYTGLGQMYVDDERFASTFESVAPGLALFVSQAMAVWAQDNLGT